MKKNMVCVLLAAALILFFSFPALACDHCDEDGDPYKYVRRGQVEPQVGVPGFTGDLCCPECGDVVIPGEVIPALEESAGPGSGGSGDADPQEERAEQIQQEDQAQQEDPAEPEAPLQPEDPARLDEQEAAGEALPETQTDPDDSAQPEMPVSPEEPEQPETPVSPEEPAQPETPVIPEEPEQPETPVSPEELVQPDASVLPEEQTKTAEQESPDVLPQEEPADAYKTKAPEEKQEDRSRRSAGSEKTEQRGFSGKYPYRRVKMQPAEGILAEGAGILIWPATASPFQSIFGE